jgi:hypothetical protein
MVVKILPRVFTHFDSWLAGCDGNSAGGASGCARGITRQAYGSLRGVVRVLFAGEIIIARVATKVAIVPPPVVTAGQLIVKDQLVCANSVR